MKVLIWCENTFIGDTLFASSIPQRLKEQDPSCHITFAPRLIQPRMLMEQNPFIDCVRMMDEGADFSEFDKVIKIPFIEQDKPVTIQYQEAAGIINPSVGYTIYTVPEFDEQAQTKINELKRYLGANTKVIAWQKNWVDKSMKMKPDGTRIGKRNIDYIIDRLEQDYTLIPIGFPESITQYNPIAADPTSYARSASIIKYCDYMIGAEGGLTNLAAGVGTKVIMTTDFIWHTYGPFGWMKKFDNLEMGPATYFPDAGHIHLDPYLTDDEVLQQIKDSIK